MFKKAVAGGACLLALAGPAIAAEPKSFWERETLTGDWGGTRTALKDRGVEIALTYINEVLDVVSGGLVRRASYEGRLDLSIDADLEKLVGWKGASAHATIYQIHTSRRTAADNVGSLASPSNISGEQTTRLFTLWFQQNWWDDRLSVRIGQLAADDEFLTSPAASGLINGTFGWASIHSANMLHEGPAYPLAAPGVRLALKPTEEITFLTAVFAGDPSGGNCNGLAQICNPHGTEFTLAGGPLWINELQYGVNQGKTAAGLPGIYKFGFWYHDYDYPDQRFPISHSSNWGVYGVADQMIWRGANSSVNVFARAGATPSNRNLVSFYVDGGVGIKGLFASRPDDVLTFGAAYLKISPEAAGADRDAGLPIVRSEEIVFELNYQAQLAPWWIVQPDLQYIVNPGGHVAGPNPGMAVKNAAIVGVRSTIKF